MHEFITIEFHRTYEMKTKMLEVTIKEITKNQDGYLISPSERINGTFRKNSFRKLRQSSMQHSGYQPIIIPFA